MARSANRPVPGTRRVSASIPTAQPSLPAENISSPDSPTYAASKRRTLRHQPPSAANVPKLPPVSPNPFSSSPDIPVFARSRWSTGTTTTLTSGVTERIDECLLSTEKIAKSVSSIEARIITLEKRDSGISSLQREIGGLRKGVDKLLRSVVTPSPSHTMPRASAVYHGSPMDFSYASPNLLLQPIYHEKVTPDKPIPPIPESMARSPAIEYRRVTYEGSAEPRDDAPPGFYLWTDVDLSSASTRHGSWLSRSSEKGRGEQEMPGDRKTPSSPTPTAAGSQGALLSSTPPTSVDGASGEKSGEKWTKPLLFVAGLKVGDVSGVATTSKEAELGSGEEGRRGSSSPVTTGGEKERRKVAFTHVEEIPVNVEDTDEDSLLEELRLSEAAEESDEEGSNELPLEYDYPSDEEEDDDDEDEDEDERLQQSAVNLNSGSFVAMLTPITEQSTPASLNKFATTLTPSEQTKWESGHEARDEDSGVDEDIDSSPLVLSDLPSDEAEDGSSEREPLSAQSEEGEKAGLDEKRRLRAPDNAYERSEEPAQHVSAQAPSTASILTPRRDTVSGSGEEQEQPQPQPTRASHRVRRTPKRLLEDSALTESHGKRKASEGQTAKRVKKTKM